MQDKFALDIGDFGKYGLLRWLCGVTSDERRVRLGVVWYYVLTRDALPPLGGTFNYILKPNDTEQGLSECDHVLYEILRNLIGNDQRSVEAVEQSGALPSDTVFYRDPVNGPQSRVDWFAGAMDAVRDCDLVFLDPDNGLVDDRSNPNGVDKKYTTYQEATQLWEQGKSLVIYQDASRRDVPTFALEQGCLLREFLPDAEPIALWYRRYGPRIFWVIPNPANVEVVELLRARVDSFMDSQWGEGRNPHFTRVDC